MIFSWLICEGRRAKGAESRRSLGIPPEFVTDAVVLAFYVALCTCPFMAETIRIVPLVNRTIYCVCFDTRTCFMLVCVESTIFTLFIFLCLQKYLPDLLSYDIPITYYGTISNIGQFSYKLAIFYR